MLSRLSKVHPNSVACKVFICFLTSAGLYYVNIMPALVEALTVHLDFTNQQAGMVSSWNAYGSALGAFIIIFFIKRLDWRPSSYFLLSVLVIVDLLSIFTDSYFPLLFVRFLHGVVGGALIGIGFSIIAKTDKPDKTFSILLLVQFGLGGLGLMLVPELSDMFGIVATYGALLIFSFLTFAMLPFIPSLSNQTRKQDSNTRLFDWHALPKKPLLLSLLSIFIFQASNMGLYAFILGLGRNYGLDTGFMSITLGIAAWMGIIGALVSVTVSTRFGLYKPIFVGVGLTIVASVLLVFSGYKVIWIIANFSVGVTWAFVMPYLLSICSRLDISGQASAMGGVASKLGIASGPFLFGYILNENNYERIVFVAVFFLVICLVTSVLSVKHARDYLVE